MPDLAQSNTLASQLSRNAQWEQQDDQSASQSSLYGGRGAWGGGGMGPQNFEQGGDGFEQGGDGFPMGENAPGYRQHLPSGFAPFLDHLHAMGQLRTGLYTQDITLPDGQIIHAKNKTSGELQDLGHDAYLKLSPEIRAQYIQQENSKDLLDSSTQPAATAPLASGRIGVVDGNTVGARPPQYPASSDPLSGFNPGSLNDGTDLSNRGRSGPVNNSMSALAGGGGINPSYHQPDAIPTGQIFKPAPANLMAQQAPAASFPMPSRPAAEGNSFNIAQYGPRYTGTSLVPQNTMMTAGATPPSYQLSTIQPRPMPNITPAQSAVFTPPGMRTLQTLPERNLTDPTPQANIIPHPAFNPGQQPPSYAPIPAPPRAMASLR